MANNRNDAVPLFSLVMIMVTMQGTWKDVLICYTLIFVFMVFILIIGQNFSFKIILLLILTL